MGSCRNGQQTYYFVNSALVGNEMQRMVPLKVVAGAEEQIFVE